MACPQQGVQDANERPAMVLRDVRLHPEQRVEVPGTLGPQVVDHRHGGDALAHAQLLEYETVEHTLDDIVAINTTMRARSPHSAWEPLLSAVSKQPWLAALSMDWDLIALDEAVWVARARPAMAQALGAMIGPGRGHSVATKVLHLKRPGMFPARSGARVGPEWQPIGVVEVDSGCVVGDPTYLLPSTERGKPGIDYQVIVDADWRHAVTPIASGMALLFQDFGGDGSYPVSGLFEGGKLVAVRVDFIEPD